jgi:peptide/nickel transport system permease protein
VLFAILLIVVVSSAALMLVEAAPGDHVSGFDLDPVSAAAERHRLGLDRPLLVKYGAWLGRAVRLDLGESLKYRRPVGELVIERAQKTALLGIAALVLATAIGMPAGIFTGSRHNALVMIARGLSLLCVSVPPLVTSFGLLLLAARTGWFPVGGFPAREHASFFVVLQYLTLPALALALPIAATLERLQSQALEEALTDPSIHAARARGCSPTRLIWRHALRLSLKPVLAVYGVIVGSVLGGSFAVEIVTAWPGLGALMYEGLVARDLYLVAGCAAAGAMFLAVGILLSDLGLALVDPRVEDAA